MLKKILMLLILLPIALSAKEPEVVPYLDLKRYTGKWFEVAHLPNVFQEKCISGSTATYRLMDNGMIEVKNECTTADGSKANIVGVARIDDKKTQSKLSVSFVEVLGFNLFWGDYWVLGIDSKYAYAVVGDRSQKYAWILSRTPTLSIENTKNALEILKQNGFDETQLKFTKHL